MNIQEALDISSKWKDVNERSYREKNCFTKPDLISVDVEQCNNDGFYLVFTFFDDNYDSYSIYLYDFTKPEFVTKYINLAESIILGVMSYEDGKNGYERIYNNELCMR